MRRLGIAMLMAGTLTAVGCRHYCEPAPQPYYCQPNCGCQPACPAGCAPTTAPCAPTPSANYLQPSTTYTPPAAGYPAPPAGAYGTPPATTNAYNSPAPVNRPALPPR